jgi:hypothetical protein
MRRDGIGIILILYIENGYSGKIRKLVRDVKNGNYPRLKNKERLLKVASLVKTRKAR